MTTRRGSQYFIQSDGVGLRSRIDPSKGKRKSKLLSGTESTKRSAISQRKVQEIPMISEPELELSMSNSNSDKSYSEGSNRNLHEPIQTILCGLQQQRLGNVAPNTPRSDELLAHPQKEYHSKKREASKEEAPVASSSKPQANQPPQEGKKNKKNNWRKPYSPSYRIPKIQKEAMDNVFNMAIALM
ncbi:hypothetical protein O181_087629 [Austropuccinia psidii MF-1]|uniref:Uncharacterized protein n=1 Tax=Austropuccinia psidii MF-1 TaxID=1389203 RepID=A0A9Q3IQ55_9BASI|nr:hypothetical protein [Austropuccinia psidii MF-1]